MNILNDKINEEVNNGVIPGMTYSIICDNKKTIGSVGNKALFPEKEKVVDDTIYDLASVTKVLVTVTLISKMLENNMISLTDSVKKYLPDFKYEDMNIYHLLTHTSGFPADITSKEIVSKEEMEKTLYNVEKEYETGTGLKYSDIGYFFLGKIIEKVYQKPLDEVAKEEIFIHLEMNDTSYNPSNMDRCAPTEIVEGRGIIRGTVHDEKAASLNGVSGHAGVFSTAEDMSHFVEMVLNDGVYKDKRILNKETIDKWFEPTIYDEIYETYRSWCWILSKNDIVINRQGNIISFNGFTGPSISIDRDNNIGIVLMTNRVHPTRDNRKISVERPVITDEIYKELVKSNSLV